MSGVITRNWYWVVIVLSLSLNGGLVYKFLIAGDTVTGEDNRVAIMLNPAERNLVLGEMRMFLSSVQRITAAINDKDMEEVANAAREVGTAAALAVPGSLMAKLPLEFKKLGLSTHAAFDQLALDAEQMGDPGVAIEQLGNLLSNCVGCHAAHQIKVVDEQSM